MDDNRRLRLQAPKNVLLVVNSVTLVCLASSANSMAKLQLAGIILVLLGFVISSSNEHIAHFTASSSRVSLPHVVLMFGGGAMILLSSCGLHGAFHEKRSTLLVYTGTLTILVATQIIVGILAITSVPSLPTIMDDLWTSAYADAPTVLYSVEGYLRCCGYETTSDRAVPSSCHVELRVVEGCKDTLNYAVRKSLGTVGFIGMGLGAVQLIVLAVAFVLLYRLAQRDRPWTSTSSMSERTPLL